MESGYSLSPELIEVAEGVVGFLKLRRVTGVVTPDNPLKGAAICDHFAKVGTPLTETTLRALVNYLRQTHRPIGSNAHGYFWANRARELDSTIRHLRERIGGIDRAARGLETCFSGQKELF